MAAVDDGGDSEVDLLLAVPSAGPGQAVACPTPRAGPQREGVKQRITPDKQISLLKARCGKQKRFVQRCRTSFQGVVSKVYEEAQHDSQVRRKRKFVCNAKKLTVGCKKQKQRALSTQEKVVVMFGKMSNDGAVALRVGCTEATVRYLRGFGAAALMAAQEQLMTLLIGNKQSLDIFAARVCWDETKYKLAIVPEGSGLSSNHASGSWSVLVQKRRYLAMVEGQERPAYFSVVVPPAFLSSTGAAYVHSGLFTHTDFVGKMSEFSRALAGEASYSFLALGCDGAYANEKLIAHIMNTTEETLGRGIAGGCVCVSATLCGNHRVNLVEASCFAFVDERLHGDMFSSSMFLQSSGMFLRLCLAAKVLASKAELRRDRPGSAELGLELAQFLFDAKASVLDHQRLMPSEGRAKASEDVTRSRHVVLRDWHRKVRGGKTVESVVSQDQCVDPTAKKYARCLLEFLLVFSGKLHLSTWHHHCMHPSCCYGAGRPFNVDTMRAKMTAAVLSLLFASMPTVPEKGKWTKTWPCLVWFAQGLGFHDTFRQALVLACEEMKQTTTPKGHVSKDKEKRDADGEVGLDIDFAAIRGARRRRAQQFATNPDSKHNLFLMCLLAEPLRYLCAWFLRASSASHGGADEWPPAMDLATGSPRTSRLRWKRTGLRHTQSPLPQSGQHTLRV